MVSVTSHIPSVDEIDEEAIRTWLETLAENRDVDELERFSQACHLALKQQPDDAGPGSGSLLKHAIAIADILVRMGLDWATIVTAILHQSLQSEEQLDIEVVEAQFGPAVSHMLRDIVRIGNLGRFSDFQRQESPEQHTENLRRMMLSIAEDIRVVLIVLAERLHAMRILAQRPEHEQVEFARETQEIYAPLANRLGIWQVKWELEDLGLRYLHPDEYRDIAGKLDGRRADREAFIADVIELLQQRFTAAGIKAEITGRPKHIYSIWRKMHRKGVDFDQIFDLRAVRVLVDSVADCYAALGVVHGIWRHIPGEFDDYIATPKANLYRSIHTAVIGPEDKPLEIQIRTYEMHQHAELGVAAHWRYKEAGVQDEEFERRIMLMRNWLEAKDEQADNEDFVDDLKAGFESQQVYVLTPQGRVIELPQGATPVDFAYAIHSDVGHHCRGARVNGKITPLTHPLQSGETIEIITSKEGGPSRDWLSPHLGYTVTTRARNRIRHWFKQQDYQQHLESGKASLEREIVRLGVSRPDLELAAARFNFHKVDDLFAAIGRGEVSPVQVAGLGVDRRRPQLEEAPEWHQRKRISRRKQKGSGDVIVAGVDDLLTHVARCCKPVPYDEIVGFITRGRGVSIHRRDCAIIRHLSEEDCSRLVEVQWAAQQEEARYPVDIRVFAGDRKGLLRDISAILTNEEVDVIGVSTQSDRKRDRATMRFTLEISDMRQLSRILEKIAQLPDVLEVRRQV